MDGDGLFTIGALARRTGLTVKTIRFYSDTGIVPSTARSPAGYRLYDITALARLDLVRTLRDLGTELAVIRQVLDREISVPEVAAAHADALEVQIRTLRLRRAVLRAVAERGSTPQEMGLMHKLAKLSDDERRRLVNDFLDDTFGGLEANPDFVALMRSAMPELPDDPEPEQVDAWAELAELTQDPDFRASVRVRAVSTTSMSLETDSGRIDAGRGDASSGRGTKAWRPAGFPASGLRFPVSGGGARSWTGGSVVRGAYVNGVRAGGCWQCWCCPG
jgi:DNA-binding transcriptional MerR regulator